MALLSMIKNNITIYNTKQCIIIDKSPFSFKFKFTRNERHLEPSRIYIKDFFSHVLRVTFNVPSFHKGRCT